MATNEKLALDVDLEQARALHRVWRALNDGDCPKCHKNAPANAMIRFCEGKGIRCPSCFFTVYPAEIEEIERLFAPAMDAAVAIFEDWRTDRHRKQRIRNGIDVEVFLGKAATTFPHP